MSLPLIINIRGNSGSGKTFLTRKFLKHADSVLEAVYQKEVFLGYAFSIPESRQKWAVIGNYRNVCGGCDTIQTQKEITSRVRWFAERNFSGIWLEGLLMSTMYGTVGKFSEQFGDRWLFMFMDTPLDVCLKRVQKRRDRKGTTKEFNPWNTIQRHVVIDRTRERIQEMGRKVFVLPRTHQLEYVLNAIKTLE